MRAQFYNKCSTAKMLAFRWIENEMYIKTYMRGNIVLILLRRNIGYPTFTYIYRRLFSTVITITVCFWIRYFWHVFYKRKRTFVYFYTLARYLVCSICIWIVRYMVHIIHKRKIFGLIGTMETVTVPAFSPVFCTLCLNVIVHSRMKSDFEHVVHSIF